MELLTNTVNDRKDKNDILLQELVNAGNWKQALANCEKRLRKGEKNDSFLVNKAHILLKFPDAARKKQGAQELHAIIERKPPITEINILIAIEVAAEARKDRDPCIASVWERAANERPGDGNLQAIWFKMKFAARDYKAAQKAAMVYQKNFPRKKQPFYWVIVSSHLASIAPDASENDRRLFGPLAYRLLSKAAADVPAEPVGSDSEGLKGRESKQNVLNEPLNRARTLQTSRDLRLLVEIYRTQGQFEEALAILDDPRTGIGSRMGEWDLVLEKIELCEVCERWEEEWQFCRTLLEDALSDNLNNSEGRSLGYGKFGNDWKVWLGLVRSDAKLRTEEKTRLTWKLIESHLLQNPVSRNAHLVSVYYQSTKVSDQDTFLVTCSKYFEYYSTKPVCFRDLSEYTYLLQKPQQAIFLDRTRAYAKSLKPQPEIAENARIRWITSEINDLKLNYSLVVTRPENLASTTLLEAFIGNCLRLYKLSIPLGSNLPVSERRPGDDAAILAAMGLIHLFRKGHNGALLRCVVVLEILLQNSRHNYDALLIIIRVYIYLGAVTRAVEHYLKLDIKHIQHQTVSWILFTRISSIHPHAGSAKLTSKGTEPFEPSKMLKIALNWVVRGEAQLTSGSTKYLDNDAYYNLLEHLKLIKASERSFAKFMLIAEVQRIRRLNHSNDEEDYGPLLNSCTGDFEDSRETKAFPDCESDGQARFEEFLRPGPMPGKRWLAAQLRTILLTDGLDGNLTNLTSLSAGVLHALDIEDGTVANDLTVEELETVRLSQVLERVISFMSRTPMRETNGAHVKQCQYILDELEKRIIRRWKVAESVVTATTARTFNFTPKLGVPDWHWFHNLYMTLDDCVVIMRTMELMTRNSKRGFLPDAYLASKVASFRNTCKNINDAYIRAAKKLQNELRQSAAIHEVVEVCFGKSDDSTDAIGLVLRGLADVPWLNKMGEALIESWQEGLDGVTRTKIVV